MLPTNKKRKKEMWVTKNYPSRAIVFLDCSAHDRLILNRDVARFHWEYLFLT